MAMFLDNTPVFLIMLVGRWSSDAFLKYMRKQVLESCKGISSRMLKNDLHHALPSPSSTIDDPRTRNKDSFASNLNSMALTSSRLQSMRTAFSLYHWERVSLMVVGPQDWLIGLKIKPNFIHKLFLQCIFNFICFSVYVMWMKSTIVLSSMISSFLGTLLEIT